MDQFRRENLDRHVAAEGRIEGAVDASHAARTDQRVDSVAPERPPGKIGSQTGHGKADYSCRFRERNGKKACC